MRRYYQGCGGIANPDSFRHFEGKGYCAEEKWDGIWAACIIQNGRPQFWSRNDKWKTEGGVSDLSKLDLSAIDDTVLVGELMAFSQAAKKQDQITYNVYDIIRYKGQDVSFRDINSRRKILETVISLPIYQNRFQITPRYYKDFKKVYEDIVKRGGEGIILKKTTGNTSYHGNTRTPHWYKVKKEVRISYVVTGYNDSTCDSWAGEVKSIIGGLYQNGKLIPVCNVGAMNASARSWFSSHRKEGIGLVVECKGYEIFKSGALRHPSLIGIRDDVEPKDCDFNQVYRR